MHFDLAFGRKNHYEEAIKLLNQSARSFYLGEHTYTDSNYPILLKAIILSGFVDFERTIRGTFGCDLHMDSADELSFYKMFPNACRILGIRDDESLKKRGFLIDTFRNINAHAVLSETDKKLFDMKFYRLAEGRVFNPKISYYVDDNITLGGVIFILLNFLREQSIATLTKKDSIFGLVSCGQYGNDDGAKFVATISHVNLERSIRRKTGDSLEDSILGELKERMDYDPGNNFDLNVGSEWHPTYRVSGCVVGNNVRIGNGSLTKANYVKGYSFIVEDEKGFIELSNMLPPFVLVDYLYENKVATFTENTYQQLKNDWGKISKLNKPKFYIDKNLKILLLPNTVSDFRILSSVLADGLQKVFLMVEDYLFSHKIIKTKKTYSTILDAIKAISRDPLLPLRVSILRNMVAHGYVLNENYLFKGETIPFSIDFIIRTLEQMLELFKNEDSEAYHYLGQTIQAQLLNTIVNYKYKMIVQFSKEFFESYPEYNEKDWEIKHGFVANSMLDIKRFNCLITDNDSVKRVIRISVKGFEKQLYLYDIEPSMNLIKQFCEKNGLKIKKEESEGLLIDCVLE